MKNVRVHTGKQSADQYTMTRSSTSSLLDISKWS